MATGLITGTSPTTSRGIPLEDLFQAKMVLESVRYDGCGNCFTLQQWEAINIHLYRNREPRQPTGYRDQPYAIQVRVADGFIHAVNTAEEKWLRTPGVIFDFQR